MAGRYGKLGWNIEIEAQPEGKHPRKSSRHQIMEKCGQGTRIGHATRSNKFKGRPALWSKP
jgi:hypothetical protein